MFFLLSALLAITALSSAQGSTTIYIAGLGDSIMRGDMLPACPGPKGPCPGNYLDDASRELGAQGLQYDYGIDGHDAGDSHSGVIGDEIPRYCTAGVTFDYTVIGDGANDVTLWEKGYYGNVTLSAVFANYVTLIQDVRQCQPKTKIIMVGMRDTDWGCKLGNPSLTHQAHQIEFNAYIKQLVATTPNAKYMDTWGPHGNADGTGAPTYVQDQPWYYGSNMNGIVNGVQTGGSCVHPGLLGHAVFGRALVSTIGSLQVSASRPVYFAALGDAVVRGSMLPTCSPTSPTAPCPDNFFDIALRNRGASFLQYDRALDGRTAGGPLPNQGVIGEELPRYCNLTVPGTTTKALLAYTVIYAGGNDVRQWQRGAYGNVTLRQAFGWYAQMVQDIRASRCHPETRLILVSLRDTGFSCHNSTSTESTLLNEYNGYIRKIAGATPGATYMDVWGAHANADGTGVPVDVPGQPWYYGANMYGVVNGVQTGGNCVQPGVVGHQLLGQALTALMKPL